MDRTPIAKIIYNPSLKGLEVGGSPDKIRIPKDSSQEVLVDSIEKC